VSGNTTVASNDEFPGKTHKTHGWFFGDAPGAVVMGTFWRGRVCMCMWLIAATTYITLPRHDHDVRTCTNTHTYIHIFIYTRMRASLYSRRHPHPASRPRRPHQGSLYCVIGISRRPSPLATPGDQPFPPHPRHRYSARRPIPGPRVCLARARAYTNGQCLQPGSPGHLFSAAFTHKIVNNPWTRRRALRVVPRKWWQRRSRLRCVRVHDYIKINNNITIYVCVYVLGTCTYRGGAP